MSVIFSWLDVFILFWSHFYSCLNVWFQITMAYCIVPLCNHDETNNVCKFFSFPKRASLRAKWEVQCGLLDVWSHSKTATVCSCHFKAGLKVNTPTVFQWNCQRYAAAAKATAPKFEKAAGLVTPNMLKSRKQCQYTNCNSDSLNSTSKEMEGVFFIPFPKPWSDQKLCRLWVEACNRGNFTIHHVIKNTFLCSKHFVGGRGPTKDYPIPITYITKEQFILPKQNIQILSTFSLAKECDKQIMKLQSIASEAARTPSPIAQSQPQPTIKIEQPSFDSELLPLGMSVTLNNSDHLYKVLLNQPPKGWALLYSDCKVRLFKVNDGQISISIEIDNLLKLSVSVMGKKLSTIHPVTNRIPSGILCGYELVEALSYLDNWQVCPGNPDEIYTMPTTVGLKIGNACYDKSNSLRHTQCALLVKSGRCTTCRQLRLILWKHFYNLRTQETDDMVSIKTENDSDEGSSKVIRWQSDFDQFQPLKKRKFHRDLISDHQDNT